MSAGPLVRAGPGGRRRLRGGSGRRRLRPGRRWDRGHRRHQECKGQFANHGLLRARRGRRCGPGRRAAWRRGRPRCGAGWESGADAAPRGTIGYFAGGEPPLREARDLRVDKRQIKLEQPLREIGTFMVEIELKDGTTAAVKTIISEEK